MRVPIFILILGFQLAAQTLPSPSDLIARGMAAQKAQDERNNKYTWIDDHTEDQLDKNDKPSSTETRTYEHIMLVGEDYAKLIAINGKPLDAKTQKKVDEALEKTAAERRKRPRLSLNRTVYFGGIELFERLFDNKVTGAETIDGRKTWRMESEPKSGIKGANEQENEAINARRVTWFDDGTGYPIRTETIYIRTTKGYQPGFLILDEFLQVGNDWLLGRYQMKGQVNFLPFVHGHLDARSVYHDYKRFTVDSTVTPQ